MADRLLWLLASAEVAALAVVCHQPSHTSASDTPSVRREAKRAQTAPARWTNASNDDTVAMGYAAAAADDGDGGDDVYGDNDGESERVAGIVYDQAPRESRRGSRGAASRGRPRDRAPLVTGNTIELNVPPAPSQDPVGMRGGRGLPFCSLVWFGAEHLVRFCFSSRLTHHRALHPPTPALSASSQAKRGSATTADQSAKVLKRSRGSGLRRWRRKRRQRVV